MATSQLTSNSYGEKILLTEANGLINEYLELDKITIKTLQEGANPEIKIKAGVLKSKTYNAFIFTKDLIMRFFDGTETDEFGNPKCANFLMILLGAHPTAKGDFAAGSFTVLTAGCERIIEKNNGKEEVKFYPLNIPKPANEYPPHVVITKLKSHKEGGETVDFFLVTE